MSRIRPSWNPDSGWDRYQDPGVRTQDATSPTLYVENRKNVVKLFGPDGEPLLVELDRPFLGYRRNQP